MDNFDGRPGPPPARRQRRAWRNAPHGTAEITYILTTSLTPLTVLIFLIQGSQLSVVGYTDHKIPLEDAVVRIDGWRCAAWCWAPWK